MGLEMLVLGLALVGPPDPAGAEQASKAPEPRKRVAVWTAPMLGSILADQVTTQRALALGMHETNSIPGMGTLAGRVAWHSAELGLVVVALRSEKPELRKAGKVAAVGSALVHLAAAWINEKHRGRALKALGR